MAQIFHPSTNTISRVSIGLVIGLVLGGLNMLNVYNRSSYVTQADVVRAQPVPFSHKHHVNALGVDCRYCHESVEQTASAGVPSTHTCMTCHSQIWARSPMLEPVRESYRTNEPLEWTRVHDLPDFAYFDHSIHVAQGVGCSTCHGPVDQMPLMWRHSTLHMEWCLDCHRNPEEYIRPREEVFNMKWVPPDDQSEKGLKLVEEYGVESKTSCSTCHR
tara:strand:+ start:148 stop:798 length:651 start_codon:yes stop_codon:yes gene_type:complete